MPDEDLPARLARLRDAAAAVRLPLALPSTAEALRTREELVAQVDDYLLPRLAHLDAPLLAVLGGSTGAGKSTLTNALVGEEVTTAGVLRPTTRAPVLVHHPDDAAWFAGDGVLPDLPRRTGAQAPGHLLHLVASDGVPPGLGLLDAPDIDSVEEANHELAAQLMAAADLWLFTTTATRYADAVPWQHLAHAGERATAVAVIVNRIPPTPDGAAVRVVLADVRRMLAEAGLSDARVFGVQEQPPATGPDGAGVLGGAEEEVRAWLQALVADAEARRAVVRRTLDGAIASLPARAERVLDAVSAHLDVADALTATADARAAAAVTDVARQLGSGVLLRGEVVDRFRETVGTAEWMDRLQRTVGRLRDRVTAAITGEAPQVEAAKGQLRRNLVGLVDDAIASAREGTVDTWRQQPGGAQVAATGDIPPPLEHEAIAEEVRRWQDGVLADVRRRAGGKVAFARGVTLGVNGLGVALMMGIFASTGGLTGGEVATAGGTAAVTQAVLTAVLGEQAVRDLARTATDDLLSRIQVLAEAQRDALVAMLADLPTLEDEHALREAIAGVEAVT